MFRHIANLAELVFKATGLAAARPARDRVQTPRTDHAKALRKRMRPIAGARRLTLLPLIAACFFIVSGGPYGLEELVAKSGYVRALWILVLTPLLWGLATAVAVVQVGAAA